MCLGIHTGFSLFTRDLETSDTICTHPEIQQLEEDLCDGVYDYVPAYDDTRVARDDYFFSLRRNALRGDAEFAFADDLDVESLEFRISRIVEQFVEEKEIRKAKEALAECRKNGYYEGQPPFGFTLDSEKKYLVHDNEEYRTAQKSWNYSTTPTTPEHASKKKQVSHKERSGK